MFTIYTLQALDIGRVGYFIPRCLIIHTRQYSILILHCFIQYTNATIQVGYALTGLYTLSCIYITILSSYFMKCVMNIIVILGHLEV